MPDLYLAVAGHADIYGRKALFPENSRTCVLRAGERDAQSADWLLERGGFELPSPVISRSGSAIS